MKNKTLSLLQRAEAFLNKAPETVAYTASVDIKKLIEDLYIHQTELQIQNEELRRAQSELEASRDRYSDLYDFAPVGYVTISEKGLILQSNFSFATMLGLERSSLIGAPFSQFIRKEDQDVFHRHRKRLFETNDKKVCELKFIRKDQGEFYAQLESITVKDTNSEITQIRTSIIDINGRKLAEAALREKDEQLLIATEGGQLGIWNQDLITKKVIWNHYLYELLGRDPKGPDITKDTFFTYIHPDDIERVRTHVDEALRNGTDFFDEFRVIQENKEVCWLAASSRIYRDNNGQPVRMTWVNYDITNRKKAEELVLMSEARYRSSMELTGQYGWTADAYGEVLENLTPLAQSTGMRAEDLKGWGWLKAVHPDDREAAERVWKEAVAKKGKYENEFRVRRYDGVCRCFLSRGVPIFDEHGSVKEWVGTSIDITERKEIERLLERSHELFEERVQERMAEFNTNQQKLQDANRRLLEEIEKRNRFEMELKEKGDKILAAYRQRDFLSKKLVDLLEKERHEIGNSLHDHIGQILTGVKLELEGLKKVLIPDRSELADRVDFIQALLKNAIMQARNISYNLRSDVLERFGLISSIKDLVEKAQKHSDIKIHLFSKNVPQDLKENGIDLALYRVTQEALTNIVKHAGAKEVFINLTRKDRYINLTIEDDGSGFDYDTFFNQENSSNFPLGITIMRERVSMLGGEFRIESFPGKGTHIQAQIPLNH
jgi:PAS domain S-box-containing protein